MAFEPSAPPLVGRAHELDVAQDLLRKTREGRGATLLIYGEAGVGKTRLASELLEDARRRGAAVLRGACLQGSVTPYLPFEDALRDYFEISATDRPGVRKHKILKTIRETSPEIAGAIPVVGDLLKVSLLAYQRYRGPQLDPKQQRERLMETVAQFLMKASQKQPLALFIDDLQWADSASLSLFHYLARNTRNSAVLLIGACRSEEIATPQGELGPILNAVQLMNREGLTSTLNLSRLDEESSKALVENLLGSSVDPELAHGLHVETEGNPFFLVETARFLLEAGAIQQKEGRWQTMQPLRTLLPQRIHDVIARRLQLLTRREREVLECCAVIGEHFTSEVLSLVLRMRKLGLLRVLADLARIRGLIRFEERQYRFDHSKIRQVIYDELPPELRREYHSQIARAYEKLYSGRTEEVAPELAHHYYNAEDRARATMFLLKAAKAAEAKYANAEAIHLYGKALELLGADDASRFEVFERRADLLRMSGKLEGAVNDYQECQELAGRTAAQEHVFRLNRKLGGVYVEMGNATEAWKHYGRALAMVSRFENDPECSRLYGGVAGFYAYQGKLGDAVEWVRKAIAAAERSQDSESQTRFLGTLGGMLGELGRTDESIRVLEEGLRLADQHSFIRSSLIVRNNLAATYEARGNYERAIELYSSGLQLAKKIGSLTEQTWLLDGVARIRLLMGEWSEALQAAEEAVSLTKRLGQFGSLPGRLATLGRLLQMRGDWEKSNRCYEEALQSLEQAFDFSSAAECYAGLGELRFEEGDLSTAKAYLEKSLKISDEAQATTVKFQLTLPLLCLINLRVGDIKTAETLYQQVDSFAAQANSPRALAVATMLHASCLAAKHDWAGSLRAYDESLRLFEKLAQPYDRARLLAEKAGVHLRRDAPGDRPEAKRLLALSVEVLHGLGAAREQGRVSELLLGLG